MPNSTADVSPQQAIKTGSRPREFEHLFAGAAYGQR